MRSLRDEDRELLLSQYLDGELDTETAQAVADKLQQDESWKVAYGHLRQADRRIGRVAQRYHKDEQLSQSVVHKLKSKPGVKAPAPHLTPRLRQTHRLRRALSSALRFAALVALLAGAAWCWRLYHDSAEHLAQSAGHPGAPIPPALLPPTLARVEIPDVIAEDIGVLDWPDGSRIWARRGTRIERIDDRAVKLNGHAYFQIAAAAQPFSVSFGPEQRVQVLGTRFELKTVEQALCLRVAEGLVRLQVGSQSVDAGGGLSVAADLSSRAFDPRALASSWHEAFGASEGRGALALWVAPWPQSGGSAAHSSITPLPGPTRLVARGERFFPLPAVEAGQPVAGAIIAGNDCAYLLQRSGEQTALLEMPLSGTQAGLWKVCATFAGRLEHAPVATPQGLIIVPTQEGLSAFDPQLGDFVWHAKEQEVAGLTVTPDARLLVSTRKGLIMFDAKNGQARWRCSATQALRAPVAVLPSQLICALASSGKISLVDKTSGQLTNSFQWPGALSTPVAVAEALQASQVEEIWLSGKGGALSRVRLDTGAQIAPKAGAPKMSCAPLSSGLVGAGALLLRHDHTLAAAPPAADSFVALAQDGNGQVFAAYGSGVVRLQQTGATLKELEYCAIAQGKILADGLALTLGKLIVTTTRGVQIFD